MSFFLKKKKKNHSGRDRAHLRNGDRADLSRRDGRVQRRRLGRSDALFEGHHLPLRRRQERHPRSGAGARSHPDHRNRAGQRRGRTGPDRVLAAIGVAVAGNPRRSRGPDVPGFGPRWQKVELVDRIAGGGRLRDRTHRTRRRRRALRRDGSCGWYCRCCSGRTRTRTPNTRCCNASSHRPSPKALGLSPDGSGTTQSTYTGVDERARQRVAELAGVVDVLHRAHRQRFGVIPRQPVDHDVVALGLQAIDDRLSRRSSVHGVAAVAGAATVTAPPSAIDSAANHRDANDIAFTVRAIALERLGSRCEGPPNRELYRAKCSTRTTCSSPTQKPSTAPTETISISSSLKTGRRIDSYCSGVSLFIFSA